MHKNQHTQRKLLNFQDWCIGEVSKIRHNFRKWSDLKIDTTYYQKMAITKNVLLNWYSSMKKKIRKISMIFHLESWLWKANFGTFWHLPTTPIRKICKIQWFPLGMLILAKNLNFVFLPWKHCHEWLSSYFDKRQVWRLKSQWYDSFKPDDFLAATGCSMHTYGES